MPFYKCISDFRHSIVIQGKKYLVGPNDVIESPSSISYIFLQEVDAETPVTVKDTHTGNRIQQQVSDLQKEKEVITEAATSSIEQLKQRFDQFTDKYEKDMDDITKQINKHFESIESDVHMNSQTDMKFREDTGRRLGILKDAVRTIEDEVFGVADTSSKN